MAGTTIVDMELDLILVVDGDPTIPVATNLTYDAKDPFAVSMTFSTGEGGITWVFARDLLFDGLKSPAGEGDVHVAPDEQDLRMMLRSPGGKAEFIADIFEIAAFLDDSSLLVPRGQEGDFLEIDAELGRLLSDAA